MTMDVSRSNADRGLTECLTNGDININTTALESAHFRLLIVTNVTKELICSRTNRTAGFIKLLGCDKITKNITVSIEKEKNRAIVGGINSTQQYIHCDVEPTRGPYTVKAKVDIGSINDKTLLPEIHMITHSTPQPVRALEMTITNNSAVDPTEKVTDVFVGQKLHMWIKRPGNGVTIDPIECIATGNSLSRVLWRENCTYDDQLMGSKFWSMINTTKGEYLINSLFAFRLKGADTVVSVTCNVRICPTGQSKCDTQTCTTATEAAPTTTAAPAVFKTPTAPAVSKTPTAPTTTTNTAAPALSKTPTAPTTTTPTASPPASKTPTAAATIAPVVGRKRRAAVSITQGVAKSSFKIKQTAREENAAVHGRVPPFGLTVVLWMLTYLLQRM